MAGGTTPHLSADTRKSNSMAFSPPARSENGGEYVKARGIQYRGSALRSLVARLITHPLIGHIAGVIFGDRIPSRGLRIDTADPAYSARAKARILFGIYESAEVELVRRHLNGARNVVELGAGLGVVSTHIIDVMAPDGRFAYVEPNPMLFRALSGLSRTVKDPTNIQGILAAISYDTSTVELLTTRDHLGSRVAPDRPEGHGPATVPARTLSAVLEEVGFQECPYFLVCDIEGAEHSILMYDTSALSRCVGMVIEMHAGASGEDGFAELLSKLRACGLQLKEAHGPVAYLARTVLTS